MFVNKEIEHIIHNKQITLYFFHKSCPIESRVRSFNNSPNCMIKIFLESDKFSHKAGVTKVSKYDPVGKVAMGSNNTILYICGYREICNIVLHLKIIAERHCIIFRQMCRLII